ncbi:hypothetical protein SK128_002946 [Halocaridina rubra]|uniref:Uncharacterized protein n=1 Tax=Halocaridina rubra TaxID=373956 RepID=A0AAN8ZXB2_HALRR
MGKNESRKVTETTGINNGFASLCHSPIESNVLDEDNADDSDALVQSLNYIRLHEVPETFSNTKPEIPSITSISETSEVTTCDSSRLESTSLPCTEIKTLPLNSNERSPPSALTSEFQHKTDQEQQGKTKQTMKKRAFAMSKGIPFFPTQKTTGHSRNISSARTDLEFTALQTRCTACKVIIDMRRYLTLNSFRLDN